MAVPSVWQVTNKLRNVHCIKHPKSDWFYVPYVDVEGNPKELHNGLSEIVCATCLIPNYDTINNSD